MLGSPDGQQSVIEAVIQAPTEPIEPEVYEQAKKIAALSQLANVRRRSFG